MTLRIRIGAALFFISGACNGLVALWAEDHTTKWIVGLGATVQISGALVTLIRPGWVYRPLSVSSPSRAFAT